MTKVSIEQKYNLPFEIKVSIKKGTKGGFIIRLPDYPGALSYAEHGGEVVNVINDLILTFFNVPRQEAGKVNFTYVPDESAVKKQKETVAKLAKPNYELTTYYTPYSYA